MRHRLTGAILLLYPRQVRKGHGPEIVALIDDLIVRERRSRTRLFIRLAVDGLVQRIASTATVWTVVAVLVATSFGGLTVSDFAAAKLQVATPRPARHGSVWTTTSAIDGSSWRSSSSSSLASWCAWLSDARGPTETVMNSTSPASVGSRRRSRAGVCRYR
jgi:hypothetical protein